MEATERLSLPMLVAGQSQKEIFHNEALQLLDILVAAAVEEAEQNDPPASPTAGTCYLVGASPTGEWSQFAHHVAAFTSSGWRFIPPRPGMVLFVRATGTFATHGSAAWDIGTLKGTRLVLDGTQVAGPQAAAIDNPAGGTVVDAEARSAVEQILAALRGHGLIAT